VLKKSLPHKTVVNPQVKLDEAPNLEAPTSKIMDNIVELAYRIRGSNRKCLKQVLHLSKYLSFVRTQSVGTDKGFAAILEEFKVPYDAGYCVFLMRLGKCLERYPRLQRSTASIHFFKENFPIIKQVLSNDETFWKTVPPSSNRMDTS